MKVRKILSDKWYMHPDNEEIDQGKWSKEAKAAYFETDFSLPPLLDGTDPTKALSFLIGSLTKEQYNQQMSLQLQGGQQHNPYWYEHVIRHGVRDWRGMYTEDESGKLTEIKPEFEDGPYGRRLAQESYDFLVFFCKWETVTIAYQIFIMSSK